MPGPTAIASNLAAQIGAGAAASDNSCSCNVLGGHASYDEVPCLRVLETARAVDRDLGIRFDDPVVRRLAKVNPEHSVPWPYSSIF